MEAGILQGRLARCVSSRAPRRFRRLLVGSVKPCRPTMRAPDKWDSPRFSGRFLAWAESRFDSESTPAHLQVTLAVRR